MDRLRGNWLFEGQTQTLFKVFAAAGFALYAVGGCVRDRLLQRPVADVDFATNATPDQVLDLAKSAKLRAIPTGMAHGTITLLVEGRSFEVTTFRRDHKTDGRHAEVQFSESLAEDAKRRDFTINALYCDAKGELIDPLGGLEDLRHSRLRFVGCAAQRICEDYLRALRFFRIHAHFFPDSSHDPAALLAIKEHQAGICRLSPERITREMQKLMQAPDPRADIAAMQDLGIWQELLRSAGSQQQADRFSRFLENARIVKHAPNWLESLAVWDCELPEKYWALSRQEAKFWKDLHLGAGMDVAEHVTGYRYGAALGTGIMLLRRSKENAKITPHQLARVAWGAQQKFPIKAADLPAHILGRKIGVALRWLEAFWLAQDCTPSREALLARLPEMPSD